MALPHTVPIRKSLRPLALTLAVASLATLSPALAQSARDGTGEVIAIREIQLKAGADTAAFERFVITTYNPGWEAAVPGMKSYIAKGDRGVQKGSYALLLIFDSEKTRNAIFPKEGAGASEKFLALLEGPFSLNKQLDTYVEPGSLSVYTDYVVMR